MELPQKITDYIDRLDEVEQDRLLTGVLCRGGAGAAWKEGQPGCLLQVAKNDAWAMCKPNIVESGPWAMFDYTCDSASAAEVGAAIRQYILDLRLGRTLAPQETPTAVG